MKAVGRVVRVAMCLCMAAGVARAVTQTPASKSDAEIKAEEADAQAAVAKQNYIAALPLYEDLHAQRPQSLLYEERLAFSLLASTSQQTPEVAKATRLRAKNLLLDAKAHGDNSNLAQVLLERLNEADAAAAAPKPEGHEWVEKGEIAFTKGDMPGAIADYAKAYEVNPKYYEAALFAGDAEFKSGHPAEAGAWFAKAIAINPDIETAHRYWGDALEKNGEHQRAEQEFIKAIVGEPYSKVSRVGLKQWAAANHAMVVAPPIKLPARGNVTRSADGKINLNLPPAAKDDPESSLAVTYAVGTAMWQGGAFQKQFPQEKVYRHSLPEEAQTIRVMLTTAKKLPETSLSSSTKLLMELDSKGMLECWILLDNPDQGIAQDYVAYRAAHRDLLEKYIAAYDVHAM